MSRADALPSWSDTTVPHCAVWRRSAAARVASIAASREACDGAGTSDGYGACDTRVVGAITSSGCSHTSIAGVETGALELVGVGDDPRDGDAVSVALMWARARDDCDSDCGDASGIKHVGGRSDKYIANTNAQITIKSLRRNRRQRLAISTIVNHDRCPYYPGLSPVPPSGREGGGFVLEPIFVLTVSVLFG